MTTAYPEHSVNADITGSFTKTSGAHFEYASIESWAIHFTPRSYDDTYVGEVEPRKRSLSLVFQSSRSKWHVRVTFHGTLQSAQSPSTFTKRTKRRKDLENLCLCINFKHIRLLDDTVTELIVTRDHNAQNRRLLLRAWPDTNSEYAPLADDLWVRVREDPFRVRFPFYNGSSGTPTVGFSQIRKERELDDGVYEVRVHGDERPYVYKEVDRPLYDPRDSEVLEQELRNLELFGGTEAIVRLVAAVVSKNPYQTAETGEDIPTVLRGILLEHHPNGTLKVALQSPKPDMDGRWREWGFQIARALDRLHQSNVTHMDLKPSNVVISTDWNAVLIDISGIGGVTREWLSPTMLDISEPLSQSIEARKQNDIWALGKVLSAMAAVSGCDKERQLLKSIAWATMQTPCRIPLQDVISRLSRG